MEIARTLLADDHALVRAGIRNALTDLPYLQIIGEVGSGPELMAALEADTPDCLLIDVTMPDFEPISAIHWIRIRYPKLRILVVSAYDDDVYVQGLLSAGVDGYHLKDQPLKDLRLAVERVLAGERWISSSLVDKLLQTPQPVTTTAALSTRQRDILRLLVKGQDNRAIATNLGLSVKTIENHLTRLYRQLNVQSRLEAVSYVRDHPEIIAQTGPLVREKIEPVEPTPGKGVAILVVDDNRRYRSQLRRMIAKGHSKAMIYEASNIGEALGLIERVSPQIAFVDVVLGDEDGIQFTRRLKTRLSSSRIILISAYPDREFHRRGLEAGATAFLDKKDLDAGTLRQIVEDCME